MCSGTKSEIFFISARKKAKKDLRVYIRSVPHDFLRPYFLGWAGAVCRLCVRELMGRPHFVREDQTLGPALSLHVRENPFHGHGGPRQQARILAAVRSLPHDGAG